MMNTKINNPKFKALIFALLMINVLSGCKDDEFVEEVNAASITRALLTESTWNVNSVMVDDLDFSSTYVNLSLTFGDGTYTSSNGGAIFMKSGKWTFTSLEATAIIIDNEVELEIIELTETNLSVGLDWVENTIGTGGRMESVSGQHIFSFTK